jgi:manganese/iron transport system ATP-binding protein
LLVIGHDLGETSRRYDRFLLLNKTIIADGSRSEVITANNIQQAYGDGVFLLQREII